MSVMQLPQARMLIHPKTSVVFSKIVISSLYIYVCYNLQQEYRDKLREL